MSFPKAQIKRFNDVTSCAPPPGKYDPKLPSVSCGQGSSFPKEDRFRHEGYGSGSNFAIPVTPSPVDRRKMGYRGIMSSGRGGRPMTRPSFNRSNSTFSLPARPGYESNEEDELELHRINPSGIMAQIQDKQEEILQLQDTLVRVEGERDELVQTVSKLQEDLSLFQNRASQLEEDLKTVETLAKERDQKLAEKSSQLDVLMANLQTANQEFANSSNQAQELHQEKNMLILQIQEKDQQITAMKQEIEKQVKLKTEVEERFQEYKNRRNSELGDEMKAQQTRIEVLEDDVSAKGLELEAMCATVDTWRRQVEIKEQFNADLQASMEKNVEFIKQLEEKVEELEQEKKALEEDYESKVEDHRQELKDALTRAAEAELQFELKTKELQEICLTVDSLKYEQDVQENELEQLRSDIQHYEAEKLAADELVSEKNSQLEAYQEALQAERLQVEELKNKIKEAEAELDMSVRSYANSMELLKEEKLERENLQNQLVELEKTLTSNHQQVVKELQGQLSTQSTELEEVKYGLSMEQANCSQLNSQLLQKSQELDVCQQNLHSAAHRISQLEANLQDALSEKTSTEAEKDAVIKNLEEKLESHVRQIQELTEHSQQVRSQLEKVIMDTKCELESERHHRFNIETELAEAQQQLQLLTEEREAECVQHAASMDQLVQKIGALEVEMSTYVSSLNEEQAKSTTLIVQLAETTSALEMTQSQLLEANSRISSLSVAISDKENELERVSSDATAWKESTELEKKKVDELRMSMADQGIKILTLEESVTQKDLELSSLMRSLDDEKAQVEIMTVKLDVTEKELDHVQKSLDKYSKMLLEAQLARDSFKTKMEAEQERVKRSGEQRAQDFQEHQKRITEFENKATAQAIEIAQLKDDLDMCQCQVNEFKAHLYEKSLQLEESQKEVARLGADLERERVEFESLRSGLIRELEQTKEELNEALKSGEDLKAQHDAVIEDRENHIKRLKQAELKLGEYLNMQLQGYTQAAEIKKSETEIMVLKNTLVKLEQNAISSKKKLRSIEAEIAKHAASSEHWKQQHDSASREAQLANAERVASQEKITQQESQIRSLEAQNANLQNLIGPFREQLKEYKDNLDMQQDAAAQQAMFAKEVAEKYASLVGHHNPKQRIHHMQKLKNDNLTLKDENTTLKKKLTHSLKRVEDLEVKLSKANTTGRRFDPTMAFKHADPEDTQNQQPL